MSAETTERTGGSRGHPSMSGNFQQIQSSIVVDAPIEVVWEVANDPASFVAGIDWVYEAWTEDGEPLGEGSVYIERGKPGMREGEYRWKVTAFDPPRRSVHYHKSGELEAELEVLAESIDSDTTRYSQVLRFRAFPAFRPLGFVLERTVMKRKMQRDFEEMILPNFKAMAELRAAE